MAMFYSLFDYIKEEKSRNLSLMSCVVTGKFGFLSPVLVIKFIILLRSLEKLICTPKSVRHRWVQSEGCRGLLSPRQLSIMIIKIKCKMYKYLRNLHLLVPPITEQMETVNWTDKRLRGRSMSMYYIVHLTLQKLHFHWWLHHSALCSKYS